MLSAFAAVLMLVMTPSPRFLALGDSYTIGESVAAADRWPNQLALQLRKDGIDIAYPEIIAKTGWTTDELSSAITRPLTWSFWDLPFLEFVMAKPTTAKIRLNSESGSGFFYVTKKNTRTMTEKFSIKKYDPVLRKHVEFKEGKIK